MSKPDPQPISKTHDEPRLPDDNPERYIRWGILALCGWQILECGDCTAVRETTWASPATMGLPVYVWVLTVPSACQQPLGFFVKMTVMVRGWA